MDLELRFIISANINLYIAVILSPNLSLYDLQKPRYGVSIFAILRATKSAIFEFFANGYNYGSG